MESKYKNVVVVNDTSKSTHFGCQVVMMNLVSALLELGVKVQIVPPNLSWEYFKITIERSDCVMINGEGTIHHSSASGARLLKLIAFCNQRKIACSLINTTWEENGEELSRLVSLASHVFVRETRSKLELSRDGIESTVVPDLSFFSYPDFSRGYSSTAQQTSGVIFTDSVDREVAESLFFAHQSYEGSSFLSVMGLGEYSLSPYREAQKLVRESRITVAKKVRVSSWLSSRTSGLVKKIHQVGKNTTSLREFPMRQVCELSDFLAEINKASLVVTGRYHVVAMCLMLGTPFFATNSNTHKIEAMLEDAGLQHRFIRGDKISQDLQGAPEWTRTDAELAAAYSRKALRGLHSMIETILCRP